MKRLLPYLILLILSLASGTLSAMHKNAGAPIVTTGTATSITNATATVAGTVDDNGDNTTITIVYGSTDPTLTTGTTTINATPATLAAGSGATPVTGALTGLTYSTIYYYQVVATNGSGTTLGPIQSFETAPIVFQVEVPPNNTYTVAGTQLIFSIEWTFINTPPRNGPLTFTGIPSINITVGSQTRQAVLDHMDPSTPTAYFIYTVQAGDFAPAGIVLGSTINLNGGSISDFNGNPVSLSVSGSFEPIPPTTGIIVEAPTTPTATTGAATGVTTAAANLSGSVNDNGGSTTTSFLWGTSPTLAGATTATATPSPIAAGTGNTPITASLTGLNFSTQYFYQAVGINSAGTGSGIINTFTTAPVVFNVSVPGNATYTASQQLVFSVGWTFITEAPFTATGAPYINVTVGNKTEKAIFDHTDPADAVVYFIYTVQPGDYAPAGITLGPSIILNGGTISDPFGDPVGLSISGSLNPVPSMAGVIINAPAVPLVTTGGVLSILPRSATIYGAVDDSGATTTTNFLWGVDLTLSAGILTLGVPGTIPAGTGNTVDSAQINNNMQPNTTYYYRAIGSNSQGSIDGAILNFTTGPDIAGTVTTSSGTTAFTALGAASTAVLIDPLVTLSDPYDPNQATATIAITSGFSPGDVLTFTPGPGTGNIAGSYDAGTGVLTLTSPAAAATLVMWNIALQSITFNNTSTNPTLGNRMISFTANDGILSTNTATKTVDVVSGLGFSGGTTQSLTVCENGTTSLGSLLTTTDPNTGDALTYSVISGPTGGTLAGFPGNATSNGSSVTPTGLTYTPTGGSTASDAFTIQVFNGSVTAQTTITVTVNPQATNSPIAGPTSVCAGAAIALTESTPGGLWQSNPVTIATVNPTGSTGNVTGVSQGNATISYITTNGFSCPDTVRYTVAVNPTPAQPSIIAGPASVTSEQTGVAYSVTNDPTVTYLWSYTPSANVTINGTTNSVTLDFTPGAANGTLSVTAVSGCSINSTPQTLAINVTTPVLGFTPASLPDATVGVAYSQTITASGGISPYTFSLSGGALPPGMNLDNAGNLTGTPTGGGSFTFQITAQDSKGISNATSYTLTVDPPTITVGPTGPALPDGTYGTAYSATFSASGGTTPYTYAVISGTLPLNMNLDANTGTLSGTPGAAGDYAFTISATDASMNAGPYSGSTSYTLHVAAATLTITADNQSMTYGATLPTLTASYSGFVNGDNAASLTTAPTITTTATSASPVGSYPITASGAVDPNYTITYVAGTLTIGQANLTITADNQSMTYGAALPMLTVSYSGFVNGDNAASLTTAPGVVTSATSASPVGSYPITASGAVDPNYTITYVAGTLTIGQANLTITADNQSMTYGAALPALTVSYSGFVNGDNQASLTVAPTALTPATSASPVGSYPITASGAVDPNYSITYVAGTLTIGQANLTITADNQSMTYGGAVPTLTVSYSGFVNGDNAASLTVAPIAVTSATSASPVGSYPITASGAVDPNYTISYVTGTLTIGQASLTITANDQGMNYGGPLPTLTVSYSGFVNGDNALSLTTAPTVSTTATAASPVGTYPITASGAVDPNYNISYVAGTLTVGNTVLTITADNQTMTYGGVLPTLTFTYSGFVNGDNASSLTTAPTISTTATAASPAGSYPITVGGAVDPNYTIVYVPGTLTISPATLNITADNQTMTYGGAIPFLSITYSGFVNGDNQASLTAAPNVATTATSASPVGTYPIMASGAVDPNYTITYTAGTLTIGPAPLTITADDQSMTAGSAVPPLTVSYSGFVNGDTQGSLTTAATASTTATSASPAGAYPITASGAVDGNYTISYVPGTLTINPAAALTLNPATLPNGQYGQLYTSGVTASNGVTPYTYAVTSGSLPTGLNLDVNSGAITGTPLAAGSFTFTITATDANPSGSATGAQSYTVQINQAALTITANNLTMAYGATVPTLTATYSGFVNGDNAASLTTAPNITTSATSASPVGSYPITVSGAVDANYTITYVPGTLIIGPAPLTITANNQSMIAGAPVPTFTLSFSGFVNGDGPGSLSTQPTISCSATSASPPGSYAIILSGAVDPNYTISYVSGALTINAPGNIGLSPASLPAVTYGTTYSATVTASAGVAPYSYAVTSGNLPPGLTLNTATGAITGTPSAAGSSTFTITATDANPAGPFMGSQPYTIVVNPASLTITANDLSMAYGTTVPTLTVTYSGFVNGDVSGSLTTQPTLATTATSTSPVGTYPITVSGAVDPNYTITYVNGTLTVTKAQLTITATDQTKVYGQANPTLTITYSGFLNGDGPANLTTAPTVSTTATTASGVGTYPITVSGAVDPNYTIVYVNGTLTITQATLLVTAADQTRYFNQPNPVLTYTYSGFVNGDNASVLTSLPDISTSATQTSAPGQYPITLSGGSAANYTLLYQDGVLTILQSLANTITFNPLTTVTYGDPDFPITATATSGLGVVFVSSDTTIATVYQNSSGQWMVHIVSAGQVTITAEQPGNGQYAPAPNVTQSLQINKANQTITFVAPPAQETTGTTLTLSASASSGLPVTFTVSDPTIAGLIGTQLMITGTGTFTVTASQPGNNDYNPAPPVTYTISVFNGSTFVSHIGVFPNPAHDVLNIRFTSDYLITKYIIFSVSGQVVHGETDVASNNNDIQVDIHDLSPGYYFVRVVCVRNNSLVYPVFKIMVY